MTGCLVVTCAAPTRDDALAIARALVEARLAACVQVGAVDSVYRWEGAVVCEPEWLLTAKTVPARFAAVAALIRARHPYHLPEIVALPVADGSPDYLAWVAEAAGG